MSKSRKDCLNLAVGSMVQERWIIIAKLGQGGFGAVYKVEDNTRKENYYAMKIEKRNIANSVLKMDTMVLLKMQGNSHICRFQWCWHDDNINYLVMALAGANLEDLFEKHPTKKFGLSTVIQIGMQCTEALMDLHNAGFLHRDVKPANFALGRDHHARVIKLLDFGLARQYLTKDGKLRPARRSVGFRGTERYASVNAHHSLELGRHDDMISLFYMLVEFLTGRLPWNDSDSFEVLGDLKDNALKNDWSKTLPKQFISIYKSLVSTTYVDEPKYKWILGQFYLLGEENNLTLEEPFDWEVAGPTTSSAAPPKATDYPYERQLHAESTVKNRDKKSDHLNKKE